MTSLRAELKSAPRLVQRLDPGPVDIIGDVHGEIDALRALIFDELGYNDNGSHPKGRRLVFLGDLVDRGPSSPEVVKLVSALVRDAGARCILGNHELNILRGEEKDGNEWFSGHQKADAHPARKNQQRATDEERGQFLKFFKTLPLVLERDDLRIVHASWDDDLVEQLRTAELDAATLCQQAEDGLKDHPDYPALKAAADEQLQERGVDPFDPDTEPPMLSEVGAYKEWAQSQNPVKVLTSGVETVATKPELHGGEWRFVKRSAWWDEYEGPLVVFGHYWRSPHEDGVLKDEKNPLFDGVAPRDFLGSGNAMCIDYGIGIRAEQRIDVGPNGPFRGKLGALRVGLEEPPELVFAHV